MKKILSLFISLFTLSVCFAQNGLDANQLTKGTVPSGRLDTNFVAKKAALVLEVQNRINQSVTFSTTQLTAYVIKNTSTLITAISVSGLATVTGTDMGAVLNSCLTNMNKSGKITIVNTGNNYNFSTSVTSRGLNGVTIEGIGYPILYANNALNQPLFLLNSGNSWRITGFEGNGNQTNQSAPIPSSASIIPSFVIAGGNNVTVDHNIIHDFRNRAIWFTGGSLRSLSEYNKIYNVGNGWNGITLEGNYETSFNDEVYNYGGLGISSYGKFNIIDHWNIHDAITGQGQQAVAIEGGGNTTVSNGFAYNIGTGIYQSGGADGTASSAETPYGYNTIINNDINGWFDSLGNGFFGGIILQGYSNSKVEGNTVVDVAHLKGIWIVGSAYNTIQNNVVKALHYTINSDFASSNNSFSGNIVTAVAAGYGICFVFNTGANYNAVSANNITSGFQSINDSGTGNLISVNYSIAEKNKLSSLTTSSNQITDLQAAGSNIKGMTVGVPYVTTYIGDNMQSFDHSALNIAFTTTLTGLQFFLTTTGAYTAANYNGVALYKMNGNTGTLVASSTNDGNIWKAAANTWTQKAFSATYTASPGLYMMVTMYNNSAQTTQPQMLATSNPYSGIVTTGLGGMKLGGISFGQPTLPATLDFSGTANFGALKVMAVY